VNYDWFTITDRGEYYYHWTVGLEYPLWEMSPYRDEVESIEVKGSFNNRVAIIHFKRGAAIEQHNIHSIITLTDDYRADSTTEGKKAG